MWVEITAACLLSHSFFLRLLSVTSVASVVKSLLGCGSTAIGLCGEPFLRSAARGKAADKAKTARISTGKLRFGFWELGPSPLSDNLRDLFYALAYQQAKRVITLLTRYR